MNTASKLSANIVSNNMIYKNLSDVLYAYCRVFNGNTVQNYASGDFVINDNSAYCAASGNFFKYAPTYGGYVTSTGNVANSSLSLNLEG